MSENVIPLFPPAKPNRKRRAAARVAAPPDALDPITIEGELTGWKPFEDGDLAANVRAIVVTMEHNRAPELIHAAAEAQKAVAHRLRLALKQHDRIEAERKRLAGRRKRHGTVEMSLADLRAIQRRFLGAYHDGRRGYELMETIEKAGKVRR